MSESISSSLYKWTGVFSKISRSQLESPLAMVFINHYDLRFYHETSIPLIQESFLSTTCASRVPPGSMHKLKVNNSWIYHIIDMGLKGTKDQVTPQPNPKNQGVCFKYREGNGYSRS
ncbi:hypothetical protein RF11_09578 [Thelohanellus kitauei]|uniref:Uncharacterized protein n=1 Tax=Thelohanellus kitauei TaxID=669202 RepID=A0A0C2MKX5_THEKT|nr:hypothetical protein RF11_09578 [Thelohanellus kitauei]